MPKMHLTMEFDTEDELRAYLGLNETRTAASPVAAPESTGDDAGEDVTRDSLDKDGMPYDEAIHADPPQFTATGEWRAKRGQADAAKAARAEFLSRGGNVTPPADLPTEPPLVAETTPAPIIPGMDALPASAPAPVSREDVFAAIVAAQQKNPALDVKAIYREFCGTDEAVPLIAVLDSNETVRANIMRHLASL